MGTPGEKPQADMGTALCALCRRCRRCRLLVWWLNRVYLRHPGLRGIYSLPGFHFQSWFVQLLKGMLQKLATDER